MRSRLHASAGVSIAATLGVLSARSATASPVASSSRFSAVHKRGETRLLSAFGVHGEHVHRAVTALHFEFVHAVRFFRLHATVLHEVRVDGRDVVKIFRGGFPGVLKHAKRFCGGGSKPDEVFAERSGLRLRGRSKDGAELHATRGGLKCGAVSCPQEEHGGVGHSSVDGGHSLGATVRVVNVHALHAVGAGGGRKLSHAGLSFRARIFARDRGNHGRVPQTDMTRFSLAQRSCPLGPLRRARGMGGRRGKMYPRKEKKQKEGRAHERDWNAQPFTGRFGRPGRPRPDSGKESGRGSGFAQDCLGGERRRCFLATVGLDDGRSQRRRPKRGVGCRLRRAGFRRRRNRRVLRAVDVHSRHEPPDRIRA